MPFKIEVPEEEIKKSFKVEVPEEEVFSKPPVLAGTFGSFSPPSEQIGPSYGEMRKERTGQIDEETEKRIREGGSTLLHSITGGVKKLGSLPFSAPGVKEIVEAPGTVLGSVLKPRYSSELTTDKGTSAPRMAGTPGSYAATREAAGGGLPTALEGYEEAVPPNIKDIIDLGMEVGQYIPAEKLMKNVAKELSKLTGRTLEKTAAGIQFRAMPPTRSEVRRGVDPERLLTQYGIVAKPDKAQTVLKDNIQKVAGELKQRITEAGTDPNNFVDVNTLRKRAKELAGSAKTEKTDLALLIDKYLDEKYMRDFEGGRIDLADAQLQKRMEQANGDFIREGNKVVYNPDASSKAEMHSAISTALKEQLEEKGGEGIRELNRVLSDMIPMEAAANRAVFTGKKSRPINIDKYILPISIAGGNPIPAALAGVNIASKSPTVAGVLAGAGRALQGKKKFSIDDFISSTRPKPKGPSEIPISAALPSRTATPAYFRKGYRPETVTPITEPSRLIERSPFNIPPKSEMYPEFRKPVPTKGEVMKRIGEPGTPVSRDLPSLPSAPTEQDVISRAADRLRITPEKVEKILTDEKALQEAIRNHEVTAEGVAAARREAEEYMARLKKTPVISIDRLRALKEFNDYRNR